jgi:hypothetical protein
MTPEGKIKAQIDALLKAHGAYYLKPVQNGLGAPGLDYHGIHRGLGFVIEAKRPGGEPTPRQYQTLEKARYAGGAAFVIDGPHGLALLEEWLRTHPVPDYTRISNVKSSDARP